MGNKRDNGMTDVLVHLIKKLCEKEAKRAGMSLKAHTGGITNGGTDCLFGPIGLWVQLILD